MELTSLIPPKLWKNVELNGDTVLNVSLKPLTWFSNFFPPNYRHINDFLLLSRESPEYVEGAAGCLLTWRRLGRGHGDDCPSNDVNTLLWNTMYLVFTPPHSLSIARGFRIFLYDQWEASWSRAVQLQSRHHCICVSVRGCSSLK